VLVSKPADEPIYPRASRGKPSRLSTRLQTSTHQHVLHTAHPLCAIPSHKRTFAERERRASILPTTGITVNDEIYFTSEFAYNTFNARTIARPMGYSSCPCLKGHQQVERRWQCGFGCASRFLISLQWRRCSRTNWTRTNSPNPPHPQSTVTRPYEAHVNL
jgi:hypothetical protein